MYPDQIPIEIPNHPNDLLELCIDEFPEIKISPEVEEEVEQEVQKEVENKVESDSVEKDWLPDTPETSDSCESSDQLQSLPYPSIYDENSVWGRILKMDRKLNAIREILSNREKEIDSLSDKIEHGVQFMRFLHTHLENPNSKNVICWKNKLQKQFVIKDVNKLASMWGEDTLKTNMNKKKIDRCLNYHSRQLNNLKKHKSERYTYTFLKYYETFGYPFSPIKKEESFNYDFNSPESISNPLESPFDNFDPNSMNICLTDQTKKEKTSDDFETTYIINQTSVNNIVDNWMTKDATRIEIKHKSKTGCKRSGRPIQLPDIKRPTLLPREEINTNNADFVMKQQNSERTKISPGESNVSGPSKIYNNEESNVFDTSELYNTIIDLYDMETDPHYKMLLSQSQASYPNHNMLSQA